MQQQPLGEHVDPYRVYRGCNRKPARDGQAAQDELSVFYTGEEEREVRQELQELFTPFRTKVLAGKSHYAQSASWRDEVTMLPTSVPTPQRFVVRVHLFEDRAGQEGRYLGFVSLRPPRARGLRSQRRRHGFSYVIDAELVAPAYMQRPRYHVLTTTTSSARLGVLPFRSAVYSTAIPGDNNSSNCIHLAVSQALHLIMGRFGCRPISQEEFRWHLWFSTKKTDAKSIGKRSQEGANLEDALEVVRSSCNGGGFLMTVEPRDVPDGKTLSEAERILASRHLTDCLACGLPVIALVRAGDLLPPEVQEEVKAKHPKNLDIPHAVLVLGMHLLHSQEEVAASEGLSWQEREDRAELPGRVIVHDPLSRGPFFEWIMSDFLKAALAAYDGADRGVHMLALGPEKMRLGHHQARSCTEGVLQVLLDNLNDPEGDLLLGDSADSAALEGYMKHVNISPENSQQADNWRLICRLLTQPEISQRYDNRPELEEFHGSISDLKNSHFWVVEVRHPKAGANHRPNTPKTPEDLPPAMVYVWDGAQAPPTESSMGIVPDLMLRFNPTPGHT